MTAALHARDLSLALGARHILEGVDLAVDPGQRIGLVGPNGVGKSTLLRIVAGQLQPDRGVVTLAPANGNVGYLPQEPERADETVREHLERRTGVAAASAALDATTAAMAAGDPEAGDAYSDALDRWLALGAADFDSRIAEVWADLGLPERLLDERLPVLSGGEAARVGLAALFLARFDVFLLDEPTNDLDLDTLRALEDFLDDWPGIVVAVSHDRSFLDRVTDELLALDGRGGADWVRGGVAAWLAAHQAAAPSAQTVRTAAAVATAKPAAVVAASPSTLRRRMGEAERALAAASKQRDVLINELGDALDHREMHALGERLSVTQAAVDAAEETWLALAAEAEAAGIEL